MPQIELRDYQVQPVKDGLKILQERKLLYLAMETRLGKTITSLEISRLYGAKSILFVTKKKAIKEISRDASLFNGMLNVDIVNHESAQKANGNYDLVIIDEAHVYKAFPKPSGRVKALKSKCINKPIIMLSATMTPESYSEIFHQFYISSYTPWKHVNFYKWANAGYVFKEVNPFLTVTVNGAKINPIMYNNANEKRIKEEIAPFLVTLTQKEAGFECNIMEDSITVYMNEISQQLYRAVKRNKMYSCSEYSITAETPGSKLQKLHQIASGTCKIDSGDTIIFDDSKVKAIRSHAEERGFNKIVIYYKFIAEGDLLRAKFKNVFQDATEFQKADKGIFISQIVSGREGIKLSTADALYFYNIDFAAVSYFQALNRMQDFNRKIASRIYWVQSHFGLEKLIYETVKCKKNFTLSHFRRLT